MCHHIKEHMPVVWINQFESNKCKLQLFHANAFSYPYIPRNSEYPTIHPTLSFHLHISTMDASQYWPFAYEYSIWNATVTAPQFWTGDLEPHIHSDAIDPVYTAIFYSDRAQQIWLLPEEILFGCFVTTLNDAFETELAQEDKDYESGSEKFNVPTLSAELQESTTYPWWRIYPSLWQTMVNHQPLQSSMKSLHLADTDTTASHGTAWYSPALMMRVLWDPVNNLAHAPALIL